jgi:lantibiotic leader peptide-processing serine protease
MKKMILLVALAVLAATTASAAPKDFVLEAKGPLAQGHITAVLLAGGTVNFQHAGTGLVMASSENAAFAAQLMASGLFNSATPDRMVKWTPDVHPEGLVEAAITPDNETFWNMQWAPSAIHAPGAWAAGCTGNGARVAILDGGIYSAHLDLVANLELATSRSFVPGFPFNQDTGTFWHGTHVAGIVAAADNGIGTIGIAPEATLIGVKVLHSGSGEFGWVISGILYAATPLAQGGAGADIINMSLGAVFAKNEPGAGPLVAALNKAVNYADRFGVLVVSAAGNDYLDLDHSGNYISVPAQSGSGIAVSATGPVGFAVGWPNGATNFSRPASYTNFGNSAINVAAPGGDFVYPGNENCTIPRNTGGTPVTNPCWVFDMVMSTVRGTTTASYSWAAGTSMAAPAASGVAALIKGANPGLSLGALKNRLAQSADDEGKKGNDPYYGRGFVNAERACTGK